MEALGLIILLSVVIVRGRVVLPGPGYNRKDVMKALNLCFDRKRVYTHEVLGVALQQLMDQTPLPVFFMRTMIQSLQTVPRLKEFIINILARLATRHIWTDATAWRGACVGVACVGAANGTPLDCGPLAIAPLRHHFVCRCWTCGVLWMECALHLCDSQEVE